MMMTALQTVHGRQMTTAGDPKNPRSRAKYRDVIVAPGEDFNTEDLGIDDKEAQGLIDRKVAKRKVREVPVEDGDFVGDDKPAA